MILGIEVGGTFTDLVMVDEAGRLAVHKLPSTPTDPSVAAVDGFQQIVEKTGIAPASVNELLHGSTIAANALIQRRGAPVALLTTRGFRDVLFIQRQDKSVVYDMFYRKPEPLITRDKVYEIDERMAADGSVVRDIDSAAATAQIDELVTRHGIESIAVCLLHAYANPAHEQALAALIADRHPLVRVSLSSDISPEHREYERTSTTVIDAYIGPAVDTYLTRFGERMGTVGYRGTPLIMQSNGGVVPLQSARSRAANMFVSGPAAAVTGAAEVALDAGIADIISVDVGGTSCDVCLITGGLPQTTVKGTAEFSIDGLPLNVVMTDIVTIGAGGGSLAHVDSGGMLQVGPESAGADPGPACYGKGGETFALTDAMLLLGLLDPAVPLPGNIMLDPDRAATAAAPLCAQFELETVALAERVYRIAISNMAQALRRVSVKRGYDPRGYALLPCGGAGPLIAAPLAEEVGIDRVLIPPHPGIFSAYGLAVADVRIDYVRADGAVRMGALSTKDFQTRVAALQDRAEAEFGALGHAPGGLTLDFSVDVRYVGQGYELRVPIDPAEVDRGGVAV
ncbi:MAG: hydantoinase/oxoprolinase family protein, partial [Alphaproteobacteria bacterium]|nr:hydantoinase/oxoprolinase family protein [Alphaproteobacteria bacterium]